MIRQNNTYGYYNKLFCKRQYFMLILLADSVSFRQQQKEDHNLLQIAYFFDRNIVFSIIVLLDNKLYNKQVKHFSEQQYSDTGEKYERTKRNRTIRQQSYRSLPGQQRQPYRQQTSEQQPYRRFPGRE